MHGRRTNPVTIVSLLLFLLSWIGIGIVTCWAIVKVCNWVNQPKIEVVETRQCFDGREEPRSSKWPAVRKAHFEKESDCAACGTTKDLIVHHIKPFYLYPDLELKESNLITLCERHHLVFGHLMDWKAWNPKVREMAEQYRIDIKNRKYKK